MNILDSRFAEGAEWESSNARYNRLVRGQGLQVFLQPYHFLLFD